MAQGLGVAAAVRRQPEKSRTRRSVTAIGAFLSILLAIYIAFHQPPQGLTVPAMRASGILVWAVSFWILEVIPEYITGLVMCTLWATTKVVPFEKAFAYFSTSTWWIMVGAFGLGVAATKCGLLQRIALLILKLFPATFAGQTLGLLGAGTIVSPLIPSANARGAIAAPIALAISDSLKYDRKTDGAAGLFGAMFVGFCVIGSPAFLSGSFTNYATMALFPKAYQNVTWASWLLYALPWAIVVFIGSGLAIYYLYKPPQTVALPKRFASDELTRLGPMGRDEKLTFLVMVVTLALWMTESIHKISSGEVAVLSICVLLAFNVLNRDDFRKGIDWSAIVYVGCIMNIGMVFQALKIDMWLGHALEPTIARFLSNPYLFVVVLAISVFLARFVIISLAATAVIFTIVLTPLVTTHGMHPWIIAFVSFASANIWFLFFMNSYYLLSFYGTGGEMVEHRQMIKLSFAYAVIAIIGFLVSVPYWRLLGLIH
jgi:DASS family divalent anion:Na+ symporter